jgi:hypothetical protein
MCDESCSNLDEMLARSTSPRLRMSMMLLYTRLDSREFELTDEMPPIHQL